MKPTRWIAIAFLASSLALAGCSAEEVSSANDGSGEDDVTSRGARFQIFEGVDGQFYFHVLAANGELTLRSEGYASKQKAQQGLDSVRANAPDRSAFRVLESRDGRHYFNLVATNGAVIGTSQMHANKSNADRGADAVARMVRRANVLDARKEPRFQTFTGLDGQSYFNLRAPNGEIVLQSEGYASKQKAEQGVDSVRSNGIAASHFEVLEAGDGQFYFRLKAANGEIVAVGETYASKSNAQRAVSAIADLLKGDPNGKIPMGAAD